MADFFLHESSYVDEGARIGMGSRIWHFCHIMADAVIGESCNLGQNTFIGRGVRIGSNCKIQNNVSIYEGVTLEDGVFCGPSCVFTNVPNPRATYPRGGEYVPTLVRQGATIGANATIVCGVTIGRHAFVGAGSVVTTDVPDYALVYGVPAKHRGWMCECGTALAFEGSGCRCSQCGREYALEPPDKVVAVSRGGRLE